MELIHIQNRIFEVRGQKVMLDSDLAELYEVETRVFNQAVKRNIQSFPEDFMFRLNQEEFEILKSQSVILKPGRGKHTKYLPYGFTEHGVTMLASVLKSEKARKMNIAIVRAFISLRKYALKHTEILEQLNLLKEKIDSHDVQLSQIYDAIENLLDVKEEERTWKERQPIGFKISGN